jgi:hypothetical protein
VLCSNTSIRQDMQARYVIVQKKASSNKMVTQKGMISRPKHAHLIMAASAQLSRVPQTHRVCAQETCIPCDCRKQDVKDILVSLRRDVLPCILTYVRTYVRPCHHSMTSPQGTNSSYGATVTSNKPPRTVDKRWSSRLGLGREVNSPSQKKKILLL